MRDARERHLVIGEHVFVVLDILSDLFPVGIAEPRPQPFQHPGQLQLPGCARVAVRKRDVAGDPGFAAKRQADQSRVQGIEARRLGIEARQLRSIDALDPALECGVVEHRFVVSGHSGQSEAAPHRSQ